MNDNFHENQDEEDSDIWQKVYRIVALILLVPMFLYLVGSLISALGIRL